MITRILFATLCCAMLVACQMAVVPPEDIAALPEDTAVPPEDTDTDPYLDEPIVLDVGDTVSLVDPVLDSAIELTFVGVREDSRCPDSRTFDVMCAWSGSVEVEMTAVVNGQSETFPLIAITDYDGVVEGSIVSETDSTIWYFAGYNFELENVVPYPQDERPVPEEYVVTVVVRRAAEPLPSPTEPAASIAHLIDETGLPALCISEMAMAKWAAGDTETEPFQRTPPLAAQSLPDIPTADGICTIVFGDGWRIADAWDLDVMWAEFAPEDGAYWIGNSDNNEVVER